jgi:hypothetical protein
MCRKIGEINASVSAATKYPFPARYPLPRKITRHQSRQFVMHPDAKRPRRTLRHHGDGSSRVLIELVPGASARASVSTIWRKRPEAI